MRSLIPNRIYITFKTNYFRMKAPRQKVETHVND
jgi:hypothetical protein